MLPFERALALIEHESDAFAAALRAGDLGATAPSCPDWTLRDLALHLGEVQRFWAAVVESGGDLPSEPVPGTEPGADDVRDWYPTCAASLVAALRAAGPDAPAWTWWGEPATAGAIARHQVQEAAVHRWDAQSVAGDTEPLPTAAADDGVDEFLSIMLGATTAATLPAAVALESTDTSGRWPVGPGEPVATVRGTASDLVLALYRRVPLDAVEVTGDRAAAEALIAATAAE